MAAKLLRSASQNKIIIAFLVVLLSTGSEAMVRNFYTCDPVDDCKMLGVGAIVPDPDFCNRFYMCITDGSGCESFPSDNSVPCPAGQYFNFNTGNCTNENGTPCKDMCLKVCNVTCKNEGDLVAIPNDCSRYYICTNGHHIKVTCPNGQVFNGVGCEKNEDNCCDSCSPYCQVPFTQIMDPFDCHNYYLCPSVGVPDDTDLYTCEVGQYFGPKEGRCIPENTSCSPFCEG